MIESIVIGGIIPLAGNLIKSIFGAKEKALEKDIAISDNAVKLAEIAASKAKSDNEFELERQKTIAATWHSGIKAVDASMNGIRIILGLASAGVFVISVIAYIKGLPALMSANAIESIIGMTFSYFVSERTCQKVF
ncbi:MAG: hypothetical protein LBT79_02275 [Elusimicrobiota bacterium]|jgi:hypothetical protein|nr:hypothetical protein [Elusimicrobiota bacterium]